jgi:hypothetical protein
MLIDYSAKVYGNIFRQEKTSLICLSDTTYLKYVNIFADLDLSQKQSFYSCVNQVLITDEIHQGNLFFILAKILAVFVIFLY